MNMTENWEVIYATPLPHRAELVKALLLEHEIAAVVINKQSSSYPTYGLGQSEVHVPTQDAILAKVILENEATFS
ncbi:putative signal transducing protein [Spirosoma fluviale]